MEVLGIAKDNNIKDSLDEAAFNNRISNHDDYHEIDWLRSIARKVEAGYIELLVKLSSGRSVYPLILITLSKLTLSRTPTQRSE
jgi:hypothetical protein